MARTKKQKEVKEEPLEKQLWKAADKLRKNIDAAEYKHVVLGLIFLKYISDSFEELQQAARRRRASMPDPEDKDEYKAENVFFVPPKPAGHSCTPRPSSPRSANSSTTRWMPSKRTTPRSKTSCPRSSRGKPRSHQPGRPDRPGRQYRAR